MAVQYVTHFPLDFLIFSDIFHYMRTDFKVAFMNLFQTAVTSCQHIAHVGV